MLSTLSLSAALLIQPSSHFDRRSALLGGAFALTSPQATHAADAAIPDTWTLSGGVKFPTLALNTAGLSAGASATAFRKALAAGITHVDFHPGIERDGVAAVLKGKDAPTRSSVFLTTKIEFAKKGASPEQAAEATRRQIDEDLGVLGVDSVDMLMLRDSLSCDVTAAQWAVLEKAKAAGRARSLGVINFCEGSLKCLLRTANEKPSVNYYQQHVGMGPDPKGLRSFGESKGIRTFAYGALGEPGPSDELLASPVLKRIGAAHGGKLPEEVALRWALQGGAAVSIRPTADFGLGRSACSEASAACADGLARRAAARGWALTRAEMEELDALTSPDSNPTLFSTTGCPDSFFAGKPFGPG